MKKVTIVVQVLLGLMMIIFGLNKFIGFMPMPEAAEPAATFMGALIATGYIMPIVALVEIITGLLILFNKYQAISLVILFPVMLNAFLFHLFLDLSGIGGALMAMAMIIFLLFAQKDKFTQLFKA